MNRSNQENLRHVKHIFEMKTGVGLRTAGHIRRPVRRAAILAAAAVCLLTVTAFAANYLSDGAIVRFFQRGAAGMEDRGNELSESQLQAVEDVTSELGQRAESNGTVLSLKSATASISSGNLVAYFVLEVEAPDGTFDGIDCDALTFETSYLKFDHTSGKSSSGGGSIDLVLPDERGRDNVKTIVYTYRGTGVDFGYKDTPVTLSFHNLSYWGEFDRNSMEEGTSPLDYLTAVAEGDWSFELSFDLFKKGLQLVETPVLLPESDYTLTSLELSALSVVLSLTYPDEGDAGGEIEPAVAFSNEIQILMRDGSVLKPLGDAPPERGGEEGNTIMFPGGAVIGSTSLVRAFYFDVPVDLHQVDAILFGGGARIEVPEIE